MKLNYKISAITKLLYACNIIIQVSKPNNYYWYLHVQFYYNMT